MTTKTDLDNIITKARSSVVPFDLIYRDEKDKATLWLSSGFKREAVVLSYEPTDGDIIKFYKLLCEMGLMSTAFHEDYH